MQAEITCIYVDFRPFPVFRPPYWISSMCQIWSESVIALTKCAVRPATPASAAVIKMAFIVRRSASAMQWTVQMSSRLLMRTKMMTE